MSPAQGASSLAKQMEHKGPNTQLRRSSRTGDMMENDGDKDWTCREELQGSRSYCGLSS